MGFRVFRDEVYGSLSWLALIYFVLSGSQAAFKLETALY